MADPDVADWMGSERSVLVHYLDKMRDAVVRTSAGLTDEEAGMPGVPSGDELARARCITSRRSRRTGSGVCPRVRTFDVEMSMDVPVGMRRADVVAAYRSGVHAE